MSLPPDSEWASRSEWFPGSSAQSSRAPSPAQPPFAALAQLSREQLEEVATRLMQMNRGIVPQLPTPCHTPAPSSEPSSSRAASPAVPSSSPKKKKVARPANAFMLFRSDMIKKGAIPKDIEQRQQNISRVAGQCWNMLPPEQKAYWHAKAAEGARLHREKHPDYKFSPERKSPRKKAPEGPPQPSGDDYIRWIRETYVGIAGPPIAPARPRKSRSRRGVEAHAQSVPPMHFPLPPSLQPSPVGTPEIPRVASAPPAMAMAQLSPEAHLAAMGVHGIPDYSALPPPPGPGFPHGFPAEYFAQYLTNTAQEGLQGDDSTPKAPTFNDPTQAKFTFAPAGEGSAEADLGLPPYDALTNAIAGPSTNTSASTSAGTSQQDGPAPSRPASPGRWDGLDSYLAPPMLGDGSSPHDALNLALDAASAYGADPGAAALDNNELDAWY
ncbi:hypothetical protein L226DRAFT_134330 [Lentinus tigrinus ALCF2SS1-7]|nr:hypothetical protein L226DRAFT_134330 [Lentinus tigrinus ALCF2SS1-7]